MINVPFHKVLMHTGQQLRSMIAQCPTQVLIRGGQLITGALCKRSLGPNGGGIVHTTWMEHGPDITRR